MIGQSDIETLHSISGTDLQRSYMWAVALPPEVDASLANPVSDMCRNVAFHGGVKYEVKQMKAGVYTLASQSKQFVNQITMHFLAPFPDFVYTYFRKWIDLSVSVKGAYRPKSGYAFSFDILQIGVDGVVRDKGRLFNAFPTNLAKDDLSFEAGKILNWTVQFSIDRVEWGNG